jgi:hypothetical protein
MMCVCDSIRQSSNDKGNAERVVLSARQLASLIVARWVGEVASPQNLSHLLLYSREAAPFWACFSFVTYLSSSKPAAGGFWPPEVDKSNPAVKRHNYSAEPRLFQQFWPMLDFAASDEEGAYTKYVTD